MAKSTKGTTRNRRITLDIPAELYERLELVAEAERRDLKPQLLMIIERAVKMHEGKKRAQTTRRAINRLFLPE